MRERKRNREKQQVKATCTTSLLRLVPDETIDNIGIGQKIRIIKVSLFVPSIEKKRFLLWGRKRK